MYTCTCTHTHIHTYTHAHIHTIIHTQGLKMHRKYSNERLVSQFGSSFLAQQRQSLYKRPVAINTSMASTASPASSSG